MIRRVLLFAAILIVYILAWIVLGIVIADQFGAVGNGLSAIIGFCLLGIIVRYTANKLFKGHGKRQDRNPPY